MSSKSSKVKKQFFCAECGAEAAQWAGQCSLCHEWNTLKEVTRVVGKAAPNVVSHTKTWSGDASKLQVLTEIEDPKTHTRLSTGLSELDRVLGGGLIAGSVVLLGGDPGIGKSTLLLQVQASLSENQSILYVTGEESADQVAMRAKRLGVVSDKISLLTETCVESILETAQREGPAVLVIDSVQTMLTETIASAPGSVTQVRESTAQLVRFAKQTGTILLLIGHVTKEGTLAGPRVLEHMVDTVLYFESAGDLRYRLIRSVKNRFGAVNSLAVFAMTEQGLKEIKNPSAIFLSGLKPMTPGRVVLSVWEGTRPLLLEVQALVDSAQGAHPKRLAMGVDGGRLNLLLAIMHRHLGVFLHDQDVFVNIVGGFKVTETAIDLALVLAILSSFKNKPLPEDCVVFGEIGLSGELRPVAFGQERLIEAQKQGFKRALIPKGNHPRKDTVPMQIDALGTLKSLLDLNLF